MNAFLILLLITGSMASGINADSSSIEIMGTLCFSLCACVGVVSVMYFTWKRFIPNPWYNWFICHHKADASAQARLMKILVQSKTGQSVFIDSDDLIDLDGLFDVVKAKLDHLVVYLTRDTLSRPWCAGEITTAFRTGGKVKVTKVVTASFSAPADEQLDSMDTYLDLTSCSLSEYGIFNDDIKHAFQKLLDSSTRSVSFGNINGTMCFHKVLSDLLNRPNETKTSTDQLPPLKGGMVCISSDKDLEAVAATMLVSSYIAEEVTRLEVPADVCLLVDYRDDDLDAIQKSVCKARAVVVLLTRDTMRSLPQLAAIISLMRSVAEQNNNAGVIPVSTPGFKFPDESYYDRVLPKVTAGLVIPDAAQRIQAFFKQIAVFFATNSSEGVISKQGQEILRRIPQKAPLSFSTPTLSLASSEKGDYEIQGI